MGEKAAEKEYWPDDDALVYKASSDFLIVCAPAAWGIARVTEWVKAEAGDGWAFVPNDGTDDWPESEVACMVDVSRKHWVFSPTAEANE